MNDTLAPIDELLRFAAPCPAPQALACDGTTLWIGSAETHRLYGINAQQGTVFEEATAPGTPIGMTLTGDALRIVCAEEDNARFIRRYIIGKDFKSERVPCPDDTGSFLAYDGDRLFLSQRYAQRILELDDAGNVVRSITVPRQITGLVVVAGRFYATTCADKENTDSRLLRIDARPETPEIVELATFPFMARSLGFDGTKFWTNCRLENEIVAFSKPDA